MSVSTDAAEAIIRACETLRKRDPVGSKAPVAIVLSSSIREREIVKGPTGAGYVVSGGGAELHVCGSSSC